MPQEIHRRPFVHDLFDDPRTADQAAEIGQALGAAPSLRLTVIAAQMPGSNAASYKRIQRFIRQADPPGGPVAAVPGTGGVCDCRCHRN